MTPEQKAQRRRRELDRITRIAREDAARLPPLSAQQRSRLSALLWPPEFPTRPEHD